MYFDILMPAILFIMTIVAMFFSKKTEAKLKSTVEERELRNRDVALMVGMIAIAVSIVIFIPNFAILGVFLFSYSSLLFTVSYAFSDMKKRRMTLYCGVFVVASILAGAAGFFGVLLADLKVFGVLAFAGLAFCAFSVWIYTQRSTVGKQKWYVAALSPALFLLLFFFFRETPIWFPYLLDVFGLIFAFLIVIYLSSLFTWKSVFFFAGFLTGMDIILVWVTGTMVQAATAVSGLGLPVLVAFPTIPFITVEGSILILRLGLGDFFFAGILATQTLKKFGKKTGVISVLTMSISFAIFELLLLNPSPFQALPATLPIILGWLPTIAAKMLSERKQKPAAKLENTPSESLSAQVHP
jgi:hypothetical protein